MAIELSEKVKASWRVAFDSTVLVSVAGVVFWCGALSQQISDLNRAVVADGEMSLRLARVESRQDMVINSLQRFDSRLDHIEENQQAILRELKR